MSKSQLRFPVGIGPPNPHRQLPDRAGDFVFNPRLTPRRKPKAPEETDEGREIRQEFLELLNRELPTRSERS
jgi:hypothetical protein